MTLRTPDERLYAWLAAFTAGLILLLIVLGAMVRLTDADLACRSTWPLCDGTTLPPLSNELAWIDWGHRLSTILVGFFTIGTFFAARRFASARPYVMKPIYLGLCLLLIQSLLGAATMTLSNPSTLPLLHLGLAAIMLSCIVASLTALLYTPAHHTRFSDTIPAAVHSATLMTFMVLMSGGLIVGSGASKICADFPLCGNGTGEHEIIHLVHRGSALLLGIILATLLWRVRSERPGDYSTFTGILFLTGLYLFQAALGAVRAQTEWREGVSALHVMFAGLTWSAAVALSMIMIKQQQFQTMSEQA